MILFWKTSGDYGSFCNFSRHPIDIDGIYYPTNEHYFQAQKFIDSPKDFNEIRNAATPKMAADMGRDRSRPLRKDWESVKDEIMYNICKSKAERYPEIKALLMSTGDEIIVEDSPYDYYWGWGASHTGRNQLGKTWMRIRKEFRDAAG